MTIMTVHFRTIYIARARAVVSRLVHRIMFVLSLRENLQLEKKTLADLALQRSKLDEITHPS